MKKLLMKWFPGYFVVNNHTTTWFDASKLNPADGLKVIEVNPQDDTMTGGLGITPERATELATHVEIQFLKCNNIVEVMVNMTSEHVKHANESFFVAHVIANKMNKRNSGLADGLLEFLKNKGKDKGGQ